MATAMTASRTELELRLGQQHWDFVDDLDTQDLFVGKSDTVVLCPTCWMWRVGHKCLHMLEKKKLLAAPPPPPPPPPLPAPVLRGADPDSVRETLEAYCFRLLWNQ